MRYTPGERLIALIQARVRRWVSAGPGVRMPPAGLEERFGEAERRAARLQIGLGAYLPDGTRVDLVMREYLRLRGQP